MIQFARGLKDGVGAYILYKHEYGNVYYIFMYGREYMTVEIFIRPECSDKNYACVSLCGQNWNVLVGARASYARLPQQCRHEAHSICAFGFLKNALKARAVSGKKAAKITG